MGMGSVVRDACSAVPFPQFVHARMADMAAFWMCEIAPTEIAGSDALNRNQLSCRQAFKETRVSTMTRASGPRRKLRVLIVDDDHDTADSLAKLVGPRLVLCSLHHSFAAACGELQPTML